MGLAMEVVTAFCVAGLAKVVIDTVLAIRKGFTALGDCPGRHRLWMHPFRTSALMTASFFPPRSWMAHYEGKFWMYAKEGSTILSACVVWDGTPMFWLADAEAIKTVTSDRFTFKKEVDAYEALNIYGLNLVSTEGDEWRRHLGVAAPAFNEANYVLNWAETHRIASQWFDELELDAAVETDGALVDIKKFMTQVTLLVISAAGFGMRTPWSAFTEASDESEQGGKAAAKDLGASEAESSIMPFHTALALTIDKLFVKVLTPTFAYFLPFRIPWLSNELDTARIAFDSLKVHMLELVTSARNGEKGDANLLRRLVQANDAAQALGGEAAEKGTLTDGELLSNIFAFLLAGHETSAHTLTFAIVLLALHPDTQKKMREEVLRVWPTLDDFVSSTYKRDFEKFEYTLAVFRETLRCFPAEPRLNKLVDADAVLTGTRFIPSDRPKNPNSTYDGGFTNVEIARDQSSERKFSVHLPKGSVVTMDIWAMHMNPLVWGSDAHIFRPDRFIDQEGYKWPRDAFIPFSAGARGCIGQRFSITESVCLLASLVRHFEILLPEGVDADNLTEEYRRKMLKWTTGITLTPVRPLVRLRKYSE